MLCLTNIQCTPEKLIQYMYMPMVVGVMTANLHSPESVSYTHLDVYKRQTLSNLILYIHVHNKLISNLI